MNTPLHHHFNDGIFRGKNSSKPCARCILEQAAPELLEALKSIPMECNHTGKDHVESCWICKAYQAIQKAENN
jgi:hypothetical protein